MSILGLIDVIGGMSEEVKLLPDILTNFVGEDMADITAGMVKELRDLTGLGMMECKKALVESGGDMKAAEDLLRAGFNEAKRPVEFKREWVGLTDMEKEQFYNEVDDWDECVDWVEAKLKEKNT